MPSTVLRESRQSHLILLTPVQSMGAPSPRSKVTQEDQELAKPFRMLGVRKPLPHKNVGLERQSVGLTACLEPVTLVPICTNRPKAAQSEVPPEPRGRKKSS